jgi:hypothetical protein
MRDTPHPAVTGHQIQCWLAEEGPGRQLTHKVDRLQSRTDRWGGAITLAVLLMAAVLSYLPTVLRSIVAEELTKGQRHASPAIIVPEARASR